MAIKPCGIPRCIRFKSWTIWAWTGWKGTKSVLDNGIPEDQAPLCVVCNKPMVDGQVVKMSQCADPIHWLCAHPDDPPDRLMGQWLAVKSEGAAAQYMEVNVDNLVAGLINGGKYRRGDEFLISTEGEFITEHTPEVGREAAKQAGLLWMKHLIDLDEVQEVCSRL